MSSGPFLEILFNKVYPKFFFLEIWFSSVLKNPSFINSQIWSQRYPFFIFEKSALAARELF